MARRALHRLKPRAANGEPKDRVLELRKMPNSDIRYHPLNWRTHPDKQRGALRQSFSELGNFKPLLAYVARDGDDLVAQGKVVAGDVVLFDGALRKSEMNEGAMVSVNITDLTEAEAMAALATVDPMGELAGTDYDMLAVVVEKVDLSMPEMDCVMEEVGLVAIDEGEEKQKGRRGSKDAPEKFQILITCEDEAHQLQLLTRFIDEGIRCKSLMA